MFPAFLFRRGFHGVLCNLFGVQRLTPLFSSIDRPPAGGGWKARQQDRARSAEATGAAGPHSRLHGVPQVLPIKIASTAAVRLFLSNGRVFVHIRVCETKIQTVLLLVRTTGYHHRSFRRELAVMVLVSADVWLASLPFSGTMLFSRFFVR